MKMKKMLATVMATALAVTMIPAAAFASGSDPIDWNSNNGVDARFGDGNVRQPIIEVTLPGDLAFEVDPLKLNSAAEILGNDYNIINHSEVPVKVIVKPYINLEGNDTLDVVSGNSLKLQNGDNGSKGYAPVSSNDATKKAVAMKAIVANKTSTDIEAKAEIYRFGYNGDGGTTIGRQMLAVNDDGSIVYKDTNGSKVSLSNAGTDDGIIWLTGDKATANKLEFLLGPDSYDADGNSKALDPNGKIKDGSAAIATSFTFTGAVDPRKTYESGEINVAADFEMKIVTDDDLSKITYQGHTVTTATGVSKTAETTSNRQQLIITDNNTYGKVE